MKEDFTAEEWHIINRLSGEQGRSYTSFVIAALAAPVLFAIYGAVRRDFLAVLIAFFGVLLVFGWFLGASRKSSLLLRSICSKLVAKQRQGDQPS
jgi:drug/metabolite transporter (DMT)-like permease